MVREGKRRRWFEYCDDYVEDFHTEEQHASSRLASPASQEPPMIARYHQTISPPPKITQRQFDVLGILWDGPDDDEVLRNLIACRDSARGSPLPQTIFGPVAGLVDALLAWIDYLQTQDAVLMARLCGTLAAMRRRNLRQ